MKMQSKAIHNKHKYVAVIGGANMDICAASNHELCTGTSNPGHITTSLGGVGRNIAENLALLGADCRLVSVVGADLYGDQIISQGKAVGINMDHVSILKHASTSTYVSILDHDGEMNIAVSDMSIVDDIDIKSHQSMIEQAAFVIADTNLSDDTLSSLMEVLNDQHLIVDTVSISKAPRVTPYLQSIHTLKTNKLEAVSICGEGVPLTDMAAYLHGKGVKNIFITLGADGVFYSDGKIQNIIQKDPPKVINSNGAGDAFAAAVGFGYLQKWDISKIASFAQNAALIALSNQSTINPEMSLEAIRSIEESQYDNKRH